MYCVLDLPQEDGDRASLLSREWRPVSGVRLAILSPEATGSPPCSPVGLVDGADHAMQPPHPPVTMSGYTLTKISPIGCAKGQTRCPLRSRPGIPLMSVNRVCPVVHESSAPTPALISYRGSHCSDIVCMPLSQAMGWTSRHPDLGGRSLRKALVERSRRGKHAALGHPPGTISSPY